MNKSGLDPLQKGRAERLDAATVGFNTQKNWSEYEEKTPRVCEACCLALEQGPEESVEFLS